MGKRKRRQSGELPLFDLPLRDDEAEPESAAGGPSILFDDPASTDLGGELQQTTLGDAEPQTPVGPAGSDAGEEDAAELSARADDAALVGDRLLGGLADLGLQLLILGLAIAACHSMGITVTFADWLPFGVLAAVFSFLYWIVPLAFWGQTPGMAWVGHTARVDGGERLTFPQSFRRWLGAVLTLAAGGLPLLLALTGRSLSDRLSGSRTVAD